MARVRKESEWDVVKEHKEYIPRQVLEHHVLEHYTNSETHFFIYEKYKGPQAPRENTDVRVMEFFDGRKQVKKGWYTKERAREIWKEKISSGWKISEEFNSLDEADKARKTLYNVIADENPDLFQGDN